MHYKSNELSAVVKEFIEIMKNSNLGYMKIKDTDFELELGEKRPPMPPMPVQMPAVAPMVPQQTAVQQPVQVAPAVSEAVSGNVVKSPIIGTFYAAAAPGKPPYKKLGDTVNKGDVICIVESMKLMNEITSEFSGKVEEIYVSDGEAVEFDQPIMRIV